MAVRPGLGVVVVLVGVLAALLVGPAHAVEAGGDDGDVDDIDCEPTAAALEDIEFLAEQEGISRDEALARYGWQECFSEAVDHLRSAYGEEFAGAAIVDDGGAWVAFRGEVPAEAERFTDEIPVAVELVGGRGFSEAELDETLQAVYEEVLGHEAVADAAGGYDTETGVITIQAQPRDSDTGAAGRKQLQEALEPEQPTGSAVTVKVRVVEDVDAGVEDEAVGWAGGLWGPLGYLAMLAAVSLALVAGVFAARRRRMP